MLGTKQFKDVEWKSQCNLKCNKVLDKMIDFFDLVIANWIIPLSGQKTRVYSFEVRTKSQVLMILEHVDWATFNSDAKNNIRQRRHLKFKFKCEFYLPWDALPLSWWLCFDSFFNTVSLNLAVYPGSISCRYVSRHEVLDQRSVSQCEANDPIRTFSGPYSL